MKILFIENRYITFVWDAIAKELEAYGHEISWIVQNKEFVPATGKIFFLDNTLPKGYKPDPAALNDTNIKKVIRADRGYNHYGLKSNLHIYHAQQQINEFIDKIQPQFAVGECTLFHELVTMSVLKSKGIPYFFPAGCRFPVGRTSFYQYDTLDPFGGDGSLIPNKIAEDLVESIATRKTQPISLLNLFSAPPTFFEKVIDKIKILRGYYRGEQYNTPSIKQKLFLQRKSKKIKVQWEQHAIESIDNLTGFNILYPLQMQPESTIDVWANEFNNQTDILKSILKNTPKHVNVIVKPNPTSNQEITPDLIELLKSPRIFAIKHGVLMDSIINKIDLVITTTGTIGVECIFANRPVVTLVKNFFNEARNCPYVDSYSQLDGIVKQVEEGTFPKMDKNELVDYINYLNSHSYPGVAYCSFTQKAVLENENISNLKEAFLDIIDKLKKINK